jgi:hypothetical protein
VPLDIVNTPPGLIIVGDPSATTAQVRVSAPRENWVTMRSAAVRAFVDLSRGTSGLGDYAVSVDVPDPRVRVIEVLPPRIAVRLDENMEKSVPVGSTELAPFPSATPRATLRSILPAVNVSGPASVVGLVESASVDLKLDGVTFDIDGRYTRSRQSIPPGSR